MTVRTASIYHVFNNQACVHLLTRSVTERDTVLNTLPQFRSTLRPGPRCPEPLRSTASITCNAGFHFYTASAGERDHLISNLASTYLSHPGCDR